VVRAHPAAVAASAVDVQDRLHGQADHQASAQGVEVLLMRRFLLPFLLTALLGATAVPAMAQSGGASAPDPNAPPSGGQGYEPYSDAPRNEPAKPPAKPPAKKPAKKAPAKKKVSGGQAKPPRNPIKIQPPTATKGHRFPLVGAYTFGGRDSRFGARRTGHKHQGQDIAAAEGVRVVAPRTGTIEVVRYQASGAGHYVVLDGDGEDRDYVFMHLRAGSITVTEGQRVRIGATLGQVGNTGVSFRPHLHFEVWVGGGWYTGGEPIDPLPLLRAWVR